MQISVKQEHIDHGVPENSCKCAVAAVVGPQRPRHARTARRPGDSAMKSVTHLAMSRYQSRHLPYEEAWAACGRNVRSDQAASHPDGVSCKTCLRTDRAHAYTDWQHSRYHNAARPAQEGGTPPCPA